MPRYHVDQVTPADPLRYQVGGATYMTPEGDIYGTGSATGAGRADTGEGTVAGVPAEVAERFEGRDFSERQLRELGARRVGPHWQIRIEGVDYLLEVTRFD